MMPPVSASIRLKPVNAGEGTISLDLFVVVNVHPVRNHAKYSELDVVSTEKIFQPSEYQSEDEERFKKN